MKNPIIVTNTCRGINFDRSSVHAEINALRKIKSWEKTKYTLCIVRFYTDGRVGNAHPCATCINEILKYSNVIKNILYSDEHGEFVKMNLTTLKCDAKRYYSIGTRLKRS